MQSATTQTNIKNDTILAYKNDSAASRMLLNIDRTSTIETMFLFDVEPKNHNLDNHKLVSSETISAKFDSGSFSSTCKFTIENEIERHFESLYNKWRQDTVFVSSVSTIVLHPDYQKIIGLGKVALPYLLIKLRDEDAMCFHALTAISGSDPVDETSIGDFSALKEKWLFWGKQKGYL